MSCPHVLILVIDIIIRMEICRIGNLAIVVESGVPLEGIYGDVFRGIVPSLWF
jgi:hypothetical protein